MFFEELKKRMEQMYKTIKVKGKAPIHYTDTAITIEDMKAVILDAKNWKESGFYKNMYQKLEEQQHYRLYGKRGTFLYCFAKSMGNQ